MSTSRKHYQSAYRLARMVRHFGRPDTKVRVGFVRYGSSIMWAAFWCLAQRRAFPPRYHWQNARRGEIFRSSRKLRSWDIPL